MKSTDENGETTGLYRYMGFYGSHPEVVSSLIVRIYKQGNLVWFCCLDASTLIS